MVAFGSIEGLLILSIAGKGGLRGAFDIPLALCTIHLRSGHPYVPQLSDET
jgi:hypothetical protein